MRLKYHSVIPILYIYRKEHLLPIDLRKSIPRSTIHSWRNSSEDSYYGYESEQIIKESLEYYELYANYQNLKKVVFLLHKVWIKSSKLLLPILKQRENKDLFIHGIQEMTQLIPQKKVLKMMAISKHQLNYQISDLHLKCNNSLLNRCFKKNPNQLTMSEIDALKNIYQNKAYSSWPNCSLYWKGIYDGTFYFSLSTFYKYIKILGLKRKFFKPPNNWKGCRSEKINEYFHIDTTYLKLPSGEKAAIVLVSDNFSRALLGFNVAKNNGSNFVKNALNMCIETVLKLHPNSIESTTLVADGGGENHALCISELILTTEKPLLKKVIALKDVSFSNSSIEAINKILKRYLRHYNPQSFEELLKIIPDIIYDYNHVRPHGSLNGRTPMNVYTETPTIDLTKEFINARKNRVKTNTRKCCVL